MRSVLISVPEVAQIAVTICVPATITRVVAAPEIAPTNIAAAYNYLYSLKT